MSRLERWRARLRLATYLAVVSSAGGLLVVRAARAQLGESALALGGDLAELVEPNGGGYRVILNGEAMLVASYTVDQPVAEVLSRVQRACRQSSPLQLRRVRDQQGVVACLSPDSTTSTRTLFGRLESFLASSDLHAIGRLRYAYARQTPTRRTHVIRAWTEGQLRLDRIAPPDGREPPGQDPANGWRPAGTQRLLEARIEGFSHALWVYASREPPGVVLQHCDDELGGRGFRRVTADGSLEASRRTYLREDTHLLLAAAESEDGSLISIVETAGSTKANRAYAFSTTDGSP